MAVGATDPGVKVGSSSGFFKPGPFHALPGTNSGIPKVSIPFNGSVLVLIPLSEEVVIGKLTLTPPMAEPPTIELPPTLEVGLESGQPETELEELEGKPQVSSPPNPRPPLEVPEPLELSDPNPPSLELFFHDNNREPPTLLSTLLPEVIESSLNKSGMDGSEPIPPTEDPPPNPPGPGGIDPVKPIILKKKNFGFNQYILILLKLGIIFWDQKIS